MKRLIRARRSRLRLLAGLFTILVVTPRAGWAQGKPGLPGEDKVRIREAFRLAAATEDKIWPGWGKAPFALLLITNDYEYLLRHPHATNNFDTLGFDNELNSRVLVRKRLFPTNLLATFPAINGLPTIVVGQSSSTNVTSSTAWVLTILHEHFHQYQQSQSHYFAATEALGLSHGDATGMWMLNCPFPYDSSEVQQAYAALSRALLDAITCTPADEPKQLKFFFSTLERFRLLLTADDFKYFSFQCWQEGVARYTETKIAELASTTFTSAAEFRSLKDFRPFGDAADSLRAGILNQLANPSLKTARRVAFYALGAGEALLLDMVHPEWKQGYLKNMFHLEKNFSK